MSWSFMYFRTSSAFLNMTPPAVTRDIDRLRVGGPTLERRVPSVRKLGRGDFPTVYRVFRFCYGAERPV
jgi:hypothetical protein